MLNLNAIPTDAELTPDALAERNKARADIRAQIAAEQAAGVKRDAKALAAERRWFAKQQKKEGR